MHNSDSWAAVNKWPGGGRETIISFGVALVCCVCLYACVPGDVICLLQIEILEKKVGEERARKLQEKERQDNLGEDSDIASVIEDQQLSPAPSCSSSEGGIVDKILSPKEGTCIPCACKLHQLVTFPSI